MCFRCQRAVVEAAPDEWRSERDLDEAEISNKIEVHVHLHRAGQRARPVVVPSPALNGVLYDWDWYQERLSKQPILVKGRWIRRRRFLRGLLGLVGLGVVAGIVAMGSHILEDSVSQQTTPKPLGTLSGGD